MKSLDVERFVSNLRIRASCALQWLPYVIASLMGVSGGAALLAAVPELLTLDEAGYGDSYILYDVLKLQETGLIYRDLSEPPYLPAQYSPLVYLSFAVAGKIAALSNPFVGPRLVVLSAFLACIILTLSIVRVFIRTKAAALLGLVLVLSLTITWTWPLQIRGDFPGIALGLLSLRLLISDRHKLIIWAGAAAGLAVQFKLIFVAGLLTGAVWLICARRWRDAARFSAAGLFSSAGIYLVYSFREPTMFSHILALSPGVSDVSGARMLLHIVISEAVVLLAAVGLPLVVFRRHRRTRWAPLLIYVCISLAIAATTSVQAGANVNYYFESSFVLIPIAVVGLIRLAAMGRRSPVIGVTVAMFMVVFFLVPRATFALERMPASFAAVRSGNEQIRQLEAILSRYRLFSTVPRIALMDSQPAMMEPYLRSYFHRMGRSYAEPALEHVRSGHFDGVVTRPVPMSWRGIPHIDSELRNAISAAYQPACVRNGVLFHAPIAATQRSEELQRQMKELGCQLLSPEAARAW